MTNTIRRGALLGAAALLLGACQWGLQVTPEIAPQGSTVSISNAGFQLCTVPYEPAEGEEPDEDAPDEVPVATDVVVMVISSMEFMYSTEVPEDIDDVEGVEYYETQSGEDGIFEIEVPAPAIAGDHLIAAVCGASLDDIEDTEGSITEPSLDLLTVGQPPFVLEVAPGQVEQGKPVVATFSWCQAENDLGLPTMETTDPEEDLSEEEAQELADLRELASDFPSIDVYVDGELVHTEDADERYPTGTVDIPLTIDEVGSHEIRGVCRFQEFEIDFEWIFSEVLINSTDFAPQAIEYPYELEGLPITWDEGTTAPAVASVEVVAASTGAGTAVPPTGAQPVVAPPSYAG